MVTQKHYNITMEHLKVQLLYRFFSVWDLMFDIECYQP
jgi:hypothetical protein